MNKANAAYHAIRNGLPIALTAFLISSVGPQSAAYAQSVQPKPIAPRFDNGITATINLIEVWSGTGYTARIYFQGIAPGGICAGGSDFAYLDSADANFQSQLSIALTAHATRRKFTAYVNLVNSQCKIMVAGML